MPPRGTTASPVDLCSLLSKNNMCVSFFIGECVVALPCFRVAIGLGARASLWSPEECWTLQQLSNKGNFTLALIGASAIIKAKQTIQLALFLA